MPRWTSLLLVLLAAGCTHSKKPVTLTFENATAGKLPPGFTSTLTGQGTPGQWLIERDPSAPAGPNVLVQRSADPTNYRFPLCVYNPVRARDVEVSVAFLPVSGQKDQAAGIAFRVQDSDNYYVVRANALENNVVAYKMVDGKRADLKLANQPAGYGAKAAVPQGQWSTLKVVARGDRFAVFLNDRQLFEVTDATFSRPGRVALWTKADSVTRFDRLRITPLPN